MKPTPIQIIVTLAALTLAGDLRAEFLIDWFAIGGGGDSVTGGVYTLKGIVGQTAAGHLSGDSYTIEGGFWVAESEGPNLLIRRVGEEAILSWAGSGFVLQGAEEVNGPWADVSPGVTTDGLDYRVVTRLGGRRKFFRLRAGECIDFQSMPPSTPSAPFSISGVTFDTYDFSGRHNLTVTIQTRSAPLGSATGLECDHRLEIGNVGSCASVTVLLASSAQAATVTAYNSTGVMTDTVTMSLFGQLLPEMLKLHGPDIDKIRIDAPAQETMLLQLCCDMGQE
ncbi:MAG TPA: hypothetical protein VNU68_10090 [Verrucomicrobiae bacterium]|nr:hypothetical protein [Verrucomicrobiae bacterium]